MKKTILMLALMLTTLVGFSQTTQEQKMRPYLSLGASYSNPQPLSMGGEIGCYNQQTWYALTASKPKGNDTVWFGTKLYRNLRNFSSSTSVYGYAEVATDFFWNTKTPNLSFNPGVYMNFMLSKNLAVGTNVGTSITNKYQNVGTIFPLVVGLSLSYFQ